MNSDKRRVDVGEDAALVVNKEGKDAGRHPEEDPEKWVFQEVSPQMHDPSRQRVFGALPRTCGKHKLPPLPSRTKKP